MWPKWRCRACAARRRSAGTPARVLAHEPQDQLTDVTADWRPTGATVRIGPVAGDQPTMPAQERLRPYKKDAPSAARQRAAQRCKQQPVLRLEPRLADLPAEDRQLVAGTPTLPRHHPPRRLTRPGFCTPRASAAGLVLVMRSVRRAFARPG